MLFLFNSKCLNATFFFQKAHNTYFNIFFKKECGAGGKAVQWWSGREPAMMHKT